jgi:hypothetical protein
VATRTKKTTKKTTTKRETTTGQMARAVTLAIKAEYDIKVASDNLRRTVSMALEEFLVPEKERGKIREAARARGERDAATEAHRKERLQSNALYKAQSERNEARRELKKLKEQIDADVQLGKATRILIDAFRAGPVASRPPWMIVGPHGPGPDGKAY